MRVTVMGAGNSGLAMAAHLSKEGNHVILWNRSGSTISKLVETHVIHCEGIFSGAVRIDRITDDIELALDDPDIVLITTPANSHKELAELIANHIRKSTVIILNPGRTLGALEFKRTYDKYNSKFGQIIAETQTIIYTCRKTSEDSVNIMAMKDSVLISALDARMNRKIIGLLPECIKQYFIPAESIIQTSIGNVGMILHCAPLLLNAGRTEGAATSYKYYHEGITPTIGRLLERLDQERTAVSEALGFKVESAKEWLIRTYHVSGGSLYECIQNNEAYKGIDAPTSLNHRYIFEDVSFGLVPLEAIGKKMGLDMKHTTLIVDLACRLLDTDYREKGYQLDYSDNEIEWIKEVTLHLVPDRSGSVGTGI